MDHFFDNKHFPELEQKLNKFNKELTDLIESQTDETFEEDKFKKSMFAIIGNLRDEALGVAFEDSQAHLKKEFVKFEKELLASDFNTDEFINGLPPELKAALQKTTSKQLQSNTRMKLLRMSSHLQKVLDNTDASVEELFDQLDDLASVEGMQSSDTSEEAITSYERMQQQIKQSFAKARKGKKMINFTFDDIWSKKK